MGSHKKRILISNSCCCLQIPTKSWSKVTTWHWSCYRVYPKLPKICKFKSQPFGVWFFPQRKDVQKNIIFTPKNKIQLLSWSLKAQVLSCRRTQASMLPHPPPRCVGHGSHNPGGGFLVPRRTMELARTPRTEMKRTYTCRIFTLSLIIMEVEKITPFFWMKRNIGRTHVALPWFLEEGCVVKCDVLFGDCMMHTQCIIPRPTSQQPTSNFEPSIPP